MGFFPSCGLFPQQGIQDRVIPRFSELQLVPARGAEKIQKLQIGRRARAVRVHGQHAFDGRRDPDRAEISQDADALVALLDVEIAQVFIALYGLPDSRVGEMLLAQCHPFHGEFALGALYRQKGRGKRVDPARCFCADDALNGDLPHPQIPDACLRGLREHLVEHRGGDRQSGSLGLLLLLEPHFHGAEVIFLGVCRDHGVL